MDTSNSKYKLFLSFEPALHPLLPDLLRGGGVRACYTSLASQNIRIKTQKTNSATGERRSASVLDAVHQSQGEPAIGCSADDPFVKLFGDNPLVA